MYTTDSPLSKLCMSTLCYDGKGLQEPFGLLPTTSLVLQVTQHTLHNNYYSTYVYGRSPECLSCEEITHTLNLKLYTVHTSYIIIIVCVILTGFGLQWTAV